MARTTTLEQISETHGCQISETHGYNEIIDTRYLVEKHVPNWVMKCAMRYHYELQGNDSKPWMRHYSQAKRDL